MRYVLTGRVVTVDEDWTVLEHGAVYIADDRIAHVLDAAKPAPGDFAEAPAHRDARHDLPGPDRAPQPPELQRAAALAARAMRTGTAGSGRSCPTTASGSAAR